MRFLLFTLLLGCSEYELKGDPRTGPGDEVEPAPDIAVSPERVALGPTCGGEQVELIVENVGDAELTVSDVHLEGDGWSRGALTLPLVLAPGGRELILLTSGPGEASLTLDSDDPDEPTVIVPLAAEADAAPSVEITSPTHGEVVEAGELTLRATVSDDLDSPDALSLTWASNVDGVISTDPAASYGTAVATWPDGRTEGNHQLSLTAVDSCGNSAVADVNLCQQGGFLVDELDIDAWHFEGSATWDSTSSYLVLTEAVTNQVGTAFETGHVVDGGEVDIEFLFYIGDGTGADGLSLTALDTGRMSSFLGGTGCGIGYGGDASCTSGPALPGWSIEVDTYYNDGQDPTESDHIMFTFDGDVDDPAVWAVLPEMEDTGWHRMTVSVRAPHVTVAIDSTTYIDQDLAGAFSFPAYIGFTAGTGSLTNRHLIDSLLVTEYICE